MRKRENKPESKIEIKFQQNKNPSSSNRRVLMHEAIRTAIEYFSLHILPYIVATAFEDIKLREEGEYSYWDITLVISGIAEVKYRITIDAETGNVVECTRLP